MRDINACKVFSKEKLNQYIFLYKKMKDYRCRIQRNHNWSLPEIFRYEKKWNYLTQKYNQICILGIEFVSIGETIPRLFTYLYDGKERDKSTYYVILPTFFSYYNRGIVNKGIFDIFGRYIHFVKEDNFDFWMYVCMVHFNKINLDYFDKYKKRRADIFRIKEYKSWIPFNMEIELYAEEKIQEMGIRGDYICLHARENTTKTQNFHFYPDTSVTNVDINSFELACIYMRGRGCQAVRMGKDESRKCKIAGIIDYANNFYDELMDFFLIAKCKFLIGCASGLTCIAAFWGIPILMTNLNVFCYGYESIALTKYDLYIPKKFYSRRKKRLLNLYELLDVSNRCDRYNERFEKEGIKIIDNTEEEILSATIEMNEKLNRTWILTEEEKICMEKYWKIMNLWRGRHKESKARKMSGAEGYVMMPIPICYSYLKENLYLLDVDDEELK